MTHHETLDPDRLSALACEVAAEATQLVADDLRAAFRSRMGVEYKRDQHDPVTEHDRRAERRIRALIRRRMPDSTIVGEEAGSEGDGRVHWYVDPIDGTANFAGGLAFFCTSVGAVVDGEVIAGAINDPMARHLFTASRHGAWLDGEPLRSHGRATEASALLLTSYPSSRSIAADGDAALLRLRPLIETYGTVRRVGSAALTLAHVAAGWADAAFGFGVNPWDVSAASLILEKSGAVLEPLWDATSAGDRPIDAPGYLAHVPDLDATVLRSVADQVSVTAVPGRQ